MSHRRVGFIVNPAAAAGRCSARWAERQAEFRHPGDQARVLFAAQPGEAVRLAEELAGQCDVVVAVGGDGTLFEVASGLLLAGATQTLLGVVPLGTGNDTARQFGVGDPEQARVALAGAHTQLVDAIQIRCWAQGTPVSRFALLFGAVGIAQEALRQTTPRVKRIFGRRLAYPVGALRALRTYDAPRMRVTCDGQTWEKRFLLVWVSNTEWAGGGLRLAPGARSDDGLLNVNVCESLGRWRAAVLLWRIFRGHHLSHPKLRYFPARAVSVETNPPLEVEADGELIGHTPVQFEVVPQAVKVLVP